MGWEKAKHACPGCGAADSPLKDADFAARRLLQGLGISTAGVKDAERVLFEQNYFDESLWSRSVRIWTIRAAGSGLKYLRLVKSIRELPGSSSFWDEQGQGMDPNWKITAYAYRALDECFVDVVPDRDAPWLIPPFSVTKTIGNSWLVRMRLAAFARATTINE